MSTQPNYDFDKLSDAFKKAQEPMQSLIDLNIKTLQDYQFIKPEELGSITKPEDFIEKQLDLAIENGHKALDYLQKSFKIIEDVMRSCAKDVKWDAKK